MAAILSGTLLAIFPYREGPNDRLLILLGPSQALESRPLVKLNCPLEGPSLLHPATARRAFPFLFSGLCHECNYRSLGFNDGICFCASGGRINCFLEVMLFDCFGGSDRQNFFRADISQNRIFF